MTHLDRRTWLAGAAALTLASTAWAADPEYAYDYLFLDLDDAEALDSIESTLADFQMELREYTLRVLRADSAASSASPLPPASRVTPRMLL